jgi:hypothetical protein
MTEQLPRGDGIAPAAIAAIHSSAFCGGGPLHPRRQIVASACRWGIGLPVDLMASPDSRRLIQVQSDLSRTTVSGAHRALDFPDQSTSVLVHWPTPVSVKRTESL